MLSKTDQAKFLHRELTSARKFLAGLKSAAPGKKDIHDIRISIKKIVALIELNKIHEYQAGNLPLLSMRSLFKITGAIRSSQIILSNLEKSGIDHKKIQQYHSKMVKNNTRKLVDQAPAHLTTLFLFRNEMTLKKLHVLQNKELLAYHQLKVEFLEQVFKLPLKPDYLHEGRKQIKHILYIQELMPASLRKQLPVNIKNMELFQDLIGKWHDTVMYLDCLYEFNLQKRSKGLKEIVSKEKDQFGKIRSFIEDKEKPLFFVGSFSKR